MTQKHAQDRIRVLIVDDSLTSRRLHQRIIESDSRFEVAGVASDGKSALEMIRLLRPDVVSMDVQMPELDGIEATRLIMQQEPLPILIVSSLYDASQKELAIQAMAAGAVHIIPKPFGPGHAQHERSSALYLRMLKNMAGVKVVRRRTAAGGQHESSPLQKSTGTKPVSVIQEPASNLRKVVIIGASAGGPEALRIILNHFDSSFPYPIVIVQHIDENFTETYRLWLQTHSVLPIVIAQHEEQLKAAQVYLAPGGKHLRLKDRNQLILTDQPDYKGHKPAVGQLFDSAMQTFGSDTIAVLLSGMGDDGADELVALRKAGAITLVQNEESCLVFGMPGTAVKKGGAQFIGAPLQIAQRIAEMYTTTYSDK